MMKNGGLWLFSGILSLVGGIVALANPLAATLTSVVLAAWLFLFTGALVVAAAFGDRGWGATILTALLGVLLMVFGILLLAQPLAGMISLTYLAGVMILTMGILRLVMAFSARARQLRGMLILSGIVSLLLGVLILANWPQSAAVVLGLFLAIELISNGVWLIALWFARRRVTGA